MVVTVSLFHMGVHHTPVTGIYSMLIVLIHIPISNLINKLQRNCHVEAVCSLEVVYWLYTGVTVHYG